LGIGDWGLGIGDWANPHNPQSPIPIVIKSSKNIQVIISIVNKILLKFILLKFSQN